MVHTQNNQYTFAQLPGLSIKGTPSRTHNKKPGAKLNPKQKPARIDKTVPRENQTDSPSTQRPKTQTSIMDYINKGRKRLNLVQLTTSDNNKKINNRIIPTNRDNTVAMIREIKDEIIYSTYPIKIPSIFDQLKSKEHKVKKN